MTPAQLSHDPLWPRTGSWPAPGTLPTGANADLGLIGLPTWRTSLSPTQAHTTPNAIRAALRRYGSTTRLRDGRTLALDNLLTIVDAGNVAEPDAPVGETGAVDAVAALAARARLVLALGGDNAATVPAVLGTWGADIATAGLITFDAHHDLRDGVSNGSPVRRLVEAGLDGRRIVQIGIADFANSVAYTRRAADLGITVIPRNDLHTRPLSEIITEACDVAGSGGGPIHVDIDVDVCDRSVAPACPASLPGGLAAHELRTAARLVARDTRVASIDLTEIDATTDTPDGRTVRLAALLVLETLAGLAER
ncbi:formimidoylglutamase [Klugiella xanthotipulae]|uniref:Formiminoglutamase n=1 Tax=Klugiella xanthotipulae TaxID=244735 RepID=A0A543HHB2_9MICO|nr:arginase family protein [Klugiella xanthotipulae]TQM57703.1 formiminoglutamase [Klugiella xanthotipulae]